MEKLRQINRIDPNERQGSWLRASPDKSRLRQWRGEEKAQAEVLYEERTSKTDKSGQKRQIAV